MTTDAAALLTRDLPRDQALGLRLLAMARAAAAMHMGQAALGGAGHGGASVDEDAQGAERMRQLLRSQAGGLVAAIGNRAG